MQRNRRQRRGDQLPLPLFNDGEPVSRVSHPTRPSRPPARRTRRWRLLVWAAGPITAVLLLFGRYRPAIVSGIAEGSAASLVQMVFAKSPPKPETITQNDPRALRFFADTTGVLFDPRATGRLTVTLELELDRRPASSQRVAFLAKSVDGARCYPSHRPDASPKAGANPVYRQEIVVEGSGSAYRFLAYLTSPEDVARIDAYLKDSTRPANWGEGTDCPTASIRLQDFVLDRATLEFWARKNSLPVEPTPTMLAGFRRS